VAYGAAGKLKKNYRDLWPGIDLVFFGVRDRLKYEFIVRPGADPTLIRLAYSGADSVTVDKNETFWYTTPVCALTDEKPLAFRTAAGVRWSQLIDLRATRPAYYLWLRLGPY
jgi:hypothetical protein